MASFVSLVALPPETGEDGWWYLVDGRGGLLVDDAGRPIRAASRPAAGSEPALLMGTLDGVPAWAVGAAEVPDVDGYQWLPLMALGGRASTDEWMLAGRAVQLVEWARTSRYCGRCGTATELAPHERAAHCPACGLNAYPRIAPAVIVIVENGDRILLARGAAFPPGMFSALAGFAEPGEPLAETVRREIREEVGIEVRDVRYFDSQPWPFPHSLMIGFFATYAGGELTPDGVEIVEADWFGADGLPNVPPPLSIARRLIDDWLGRTS